MRLFSPFMSIDESIVLHYWLYQVSHQLTYRFALDLRDLALITSPGGLAPYLSGQDTCSSHPTNFDQNEYSKCANSEIHPGKIEWCPQKLRWSSNVLHSVMRL